MARLFLALWPDAAAAGRLESLAQELAEVAGGRAVPRAKIHLTLVFLGEVAGDRLAAVNARAAAIRAAPFDARFDCVGAFRNAGVAWTGMRSVPEPLAALQSALDATLREAGFALDGRPYVPHVTLARRITRPVRTRDIDPIDWRAREFALVRSEAGTGLYTLLESWRLAP